MKKVIGIMVGLVLMTYAPTASAYNIRLVDVPCPEWQQELNGCFKRRGSEIQIKKNMGEEMTRFVLYHEIGHLYTWDNMYQFREISTDREDIADLFAFWILGYVPSSNPNLWQEKFGKVCDVKCVAEIKKLKI